MFSKLSLPTLSIAMDINTTQKPYPTPLKDCYQYKNANYLVKNYLYYINIKLLTSKQQKELIEDLLALKNVVLEEEYKRNL